MHQAYRRPRMAAFRRSFTGLNWRQLADSGSSALPDTGRSPLSAVSSLCATAAEGRWRRCERGFWQFRPGYPGPRRVSFGTLTAMTMTPHHFTISAENVEHHKSRSAAMRNVYDAFMSSVFCYPPNQLTVFPGAEIAGNFLPSEIPSKSFA